VQNHQNAASSSSHPQQLSVSPSQQTQQVQQPQYEVLQPQQPQQPYQPQLQQQEQQLQDLCNLQQLQGLYDPQYQLDSYNLQQHHQQQQNSYNTQQQQDSYNLQQTEYISIMEQVLGDSLEFPFASSEAPQLVASDTPTIHSFDTSVYSPSEFSVNDDLMQYQNDSPINFYSFIPLHDSLSIIYNPTHPDSDQGYQGFDGGH
jgi:hypothetical protein